VSETRVHCTTSEPFMPARRTARLSTFLEAIRETRFGQEPELTQIHSKATIQGS
jgi:hypothetical protein